MRRWLIGFIAAEDQEHGVVLPAANFSDGWETVEVVPLSEVKEALLGEDAKEAAREDAESASVYCDLDPEYVEPMIVAALEAAVRFLPSTDSEGQS